MSKERALWLVRNTVQGQEKLELLHLVNNRPEIWEGLLEDELIGVLQIELRNYNGDSSGGAPHGGQA